MIKYIKTKKKQKNSGHSPLQPHLLHGEHLLCEGGHFSFGSHLELQAASATGIKVGLQSRQLEGRGEGG